MKASAATIAPAALVLLAAGCGGGGTSPSMSPGGSWQITITRHDLTENPAYNRDAGGSLVKSDTGTFRLVLRYGRFSWSHARSTQPPGTGTYRVKSHTIIFRVEHGGVPETFAYRWSIYRDRLVLSTSRGAYATGPANVLFVPWRRVN